MGPAQFRCSAKLRRARKGNISPLPETRFAARQLVVLGSSITALAVVRSAHALGMSPLLFDTRREIAAATRLARLEIHPGIPRSEIAERLIAIGREAPSALISTSDSWLRFIAAHRRALEQAYVRILHPGNHTLAICLDKEKFAAWCERHGLPAPRRYTASSHLRPRTAPLPFPLLVRPTESGHPRAVGRLPKGAEVRTTAEFERLLERFRRAQVKPTVSESLLGRPITQYSVGVARAGGRTLSFVARKLRPVASACTAGTCVETAQHPAVERLARRAAELLDYEGIAEVEVLHDEATDESFLIEVNARPWLQFALGHALGLDLLAFALSDGALGAGDGRGAPARAALWLDFQGDLYACFGRNDGLVRAGRLSLVDYLGSLARASVFARWSRADARPFWSAAIDFVADRARRLLGRRAAPTGSGTAPISAGHSNGVKGPRFAANGNGRRRLRPARRAGPRPRRIRGRVSLREHRWQP